MYFTSKLRLIQQQQLIDMCQRKHKCNHNHMTNDWWSSTAQARGNDGHVYKTIEEIQYHHNNVEPLVGFYFSNTDEYFVAYGNNGNLQLVEITFSAQTFTPHECLGLFYEHTILELDSQWHQHSTLQSALEYGKCCLFLPCPDVSRGGLNYCVVFPDWQIRLPHRSIGLP